MKNNEAVASISFPLLQILTGTNTWKILRMIISNFHFILLHLLECNRQVATILSHAKLINISSSMWSNVSTSNAYKYIITGHKKQISVNATLNNEVQAIKWQLFWSEVTLHINYTVLWCLLILVWGSNPSIFQQYNLDFHNKAKS